MPDRTAISSTKKRYATVIALAILGGALVWMGWQRSNATASPPSPSASASPATAPAAANDTAAATSSTAVSATVQIVFTTVPATHATVTWGKTRLGVIAPGKPLVVVRPRDSGPLDVIVHTAGFLPVHTRAHTFADTNIGVKLTRPDQKSTLLGYQMPLDAGPPVTPETSEPPAASAPQQP